VDGDVEAGEGGGGAGDGGIDGGFGGGVEGEGEDVAVRVESAEGVGRGRERGRVDVAQGELGDAVVGEGVGGALADSCGEWCEVGEVGGVGVGGSQGLPQ
jgi:hypothetical protein